MTQFPDKVFAEATKLPAEELEADRRWNEAFARSQDQLAQMAENALAEHPAGKTKLLNVPGVRPRRAAI